MQIADFRSDTVTLPTPQMREAMLTAPLGDDVYGDDPTVRQLEAEAARLTGFEAGLFMPSGTMANQVALHVHCRPGQEVIVPEGAHIYEYEPGSMSVISGLLPRVVPAPLGVPAPDGVEAAIQDSPHRAETGLITVENTHNSAGGTVVPLEAAAALTGLGRRHGLPVHLDAARGFNAAVALGTDIATVCAGFDSASICLSKGLSAPVGSVLLGTERFITRAHRIRKLLGGGMRQAGVLAAAGLVALETMPEKLAADHARARELAERLRHLPGLTVDMASVQTNMVFARTPEAVRLAEKLRDRGVLCNAFTRTALRFVTHHQLDDADVGRAALALTEVLQEDGHA
ncbi:MAG TPA: GntG family PLP-dependent aldolase [Deinococcales bacterium]|nr:GntG family PLP-dependent aldolase [Deinococcales bacterium]